MIITEIGNDMYRGFFVGRNLIQVLKHVDVNAENTLSYELLKASPLHTASGFSNSSQLNLKIQLVHL